MGLNTTEILVIVGVIILLFGATAIPKFARSIGRAKSEFKKGLREGHEEAETEDRKADETAKREPSQKP
jgi:sec-independent protein translocase protein TatA